MSMYLKFGGITGDVTESGHANWIELNSLQWGIGRGVSGATGSASDREASAPSVSEITITKDQDSASIKLLTQAFNGDGSGDAASIQIDFTRTAAGKLDVYETITLSNVIISGFSISSGGDRPTESISLNFTKIDVKITPMKPDGTPGNGANVSYDLAQAKTV